MHPLISQPGFKAPVLLEDSSSVIIEADDTLVDPYASPCPQGLLLQNDLFLVESALRTDRPRRCELYDPNGSAPPLPLNVLDLRLRCLRCGELARRFKVPGELPRFELSNDTCTIIERCAMRCACEETLRLEVTLAPLQSRTTHLYHRYRLSLPPESAYRVEHLFEIPASSLRQSHNQLEPRSSARRLHDFTLFFQGRAVSQVYDIPKSVSPQGASFAEGALQNLFEVRNDEAHTRESVLQISCTHLCRTDFPECVRYFRFVHTDAYLPSAPDLLEQHAGHWKSVRTKLRWTTKPELAPNDAEQHARLALSTEVATFESQMLFHDIDEDDMVGMPIVTLTRPSQAKKILARRIARIDEQLAHHMGHEGGIARWRENQIKFWSRASANRIYRNALLIIHIWQYFQHTRDYAWLESVGYPGIYKSASYIIEFRQVDPSSGVIRFEHVKDILGRDVENDLFTDRVCALALRYASMAAWKLNFKHQTVWEEYDAIQKGLLEESGESFDARDKALLVDVELLHGVATYVFFCLEEHEPEPRRIGHLWGARCGTRILVNALTTLARSQLVRSSYPIEIRDDYDRLIAPAEGDRLSLFNARHYNFKWQNDLFGVTRAVVAHSFGTDAFTSFPSKEPLQRGYPSASLKTELALALCSPYTTMPRYQEKDQLEALEKALDHAPSSLLPHGLGMLGAKIANMRHMRFIDQWKCVSYLTEALLGEARSSKNTMFLLLFGLLAIEFRGETNKFLGTEEDYRTECFNYGVLPPFADRIVVENLPSLETINIRNNLFKAELEGATLSRDPPHLLSYRPATDSESSSYLVLLNSFAMKLHVAPTYTAPTLFTAERSVSKGTNYGGEYPLFLTDSVAIKGLVESKPFNCAVELYDHDYALRDPLPNARGRLSYVYDPTHGNGVVLRLALDTLDQTGYLPADRVVLHLEFQEIFRRLDVEMLSESAPLEELDLSGRRERTVSRALSTPASGSEIESMQLTFFVMPGREYLLRHSPLLRAEIELLMNDRSLFRYRSRKPMLLDQTTPPFESYARELPLASGRIDATVYFERTAVPSEPLPQTVDGWHQLDPLLEDPLLEPLAPELRPQELLSNNRQRTPTYDIALTSEGVAMSERDGPLFERYFGSTYGQVLAAINTHLRSHTPRWLRGFRTHIILCAEDHRLYAIGTHVNFYRVTKIRHIVLTEVTELEGLRPHIEEGQTIVDAREGQEGDSLRFLVRRGEHFAWWGIGTNYQNTLGLSAYDPLILQDAVGNIQKVYEELLYLDMLNERLDVGYHRMVTVAPSAEGRSDENVLYDKIERALYVLGGSSPYATRWHTVPLREKLGDRNVRCIFYDNARKRVLVGLAES